MGSRALLLGLALLALHAPNDASAALSDNLVSNGSFESSSGVVPSGWLIVSGSAPRLTTQGCDDPASGERCLRLDTSGSSAGALEDGPLRLESASPIPARPGHVYRFQLHVRLEESAQIEQKALEARLLFRDTDGVHLARIYVPFFVERGLNGAWTALQRDLVAPPGTDHLEVRLGTFHYAGDAFHGVVSVDDVSVRELHRTELRIRSARSRAFHAVPPGVVPVPGFRAIPHDLVMDGDRRVYGWEHDATGRTQRAAGYPTHLQGHCVGSDRLELPLPDGRWVVTLYMGTLWRWGIERMNHRVRVNGVVPPGLDERRSRDELMDRFYFASAEATLAEPVDLEKDGYAVHRRSIAPYFRRHDLRVDVEHGRLELDLESGHLCALVATRLENAEEHMRAMDVLDAELVQEFVDTWAERLPTSRHRGHRVGSHRPARKDYVLFRRRWMRAVEHDSRPDDHEVDGALDVRATPGEYEPVTFSIWPQRDLHDVAIRVSTLRSRAGDRLPADAIRVLYLQQKAARRGVPATAYRIEGHFLPEWGVRDLHADIVQRAWLLAHVPSEAAPGVYRGFVRVHARGGGTRALRLRVTVLPFRLERPERVHVMRYAGAAVVLPYSAQLPVLGNDVRNKQFYRQQALDHLHETGLAPELLPPLPRSCDPAESVPDWEAKTTDGPPSQHLRMIAESPAGARDWVWVSVEGMPCLLDAFDAKVTGSWTIADVERYLRGIYRVVTGEYRYRRVYLHASAEETKMLRSMSRTRAWLDLLRFVRERSPEQWPGLRVVHTANSEAGQPLALEAADIVALGMFHGVNAVDAADQVEQARAMGSPYMMYGVRGRFVPGFYLWKAGALGTFHEFYSYYYGGPVNDDWHNDALNVGERATLAKHPHHANALYSAKGRMIGSWFTEEVREGIDDDAYLNTLAHWTERTALIDENARALRKNAACRGAFLRARHTLSEIEDRIDLDVERTALRGGLYRPIAPETFDAWRREVSGAILILKGAEEAFQRRGVRSGVERWCRQVTTCELRSKPGSRDGSICGVGSASAGKARRRRKP